MEFSPVKRHNIDSSTFKALERNSFCIFTHFPGWMLFESVSTKTPLMVLYFVTMGTSSTGLMQLYGKIDHYTKGIVGKQNITCTLQLLVSHLQNIKIHFQTFLKNIYLINYAYIKHNKKSPCSDAAVRFSCFFIVYVCVFIVYVWILTRMTVKMCKVGKVCVARGLWGWGRKNVSA